MSRGHFTTHALSRCRERGIDPEEVILTVEDGAVFRAGRDAIMYRRGSVRVVVGLDGGIVTAFRRRPSTHKRTAKRKRQKSGPFSVLRRRDRSAEGSGRSEMRISRNMWMRGGYSEAVV